MRKSEGEDSVAETLQTLFFCCIWISVIAGAAHSLSNTRVGSPGGVEPHKRCILNHLAHYLQVAARYFVRKNIK